MSLDLPASLERDIEQYARDEQISPKKAVVRLLKKALSSSKRRGQTVAPLTEEEMKQLDGFGKTFGLLADVPDEDIDRMSASIRKMKRERFPASA